MLAHQLRHDGDILGRLEAAELLGARVADAKAIAALMGALEADTAWAVRARAATALGRADSGVGGALMRATRDADSRVRTAAVSALAMPAAASRSATDSTAPPLARRTVSDADLEWIRRMATEDSSRYVRGAALAAYARLDPQAALAAIELALGRDSWLDIERTNAVNALAAIGTTDAWQRTLRYLSPQTSRQTRQTAIAALVRGAAGREAGLAEAIAPLLDADDLFIRSAAARALGTLGQASSIPALEARRAVEAESRVIHVILGALDALRSRRK